MVFMKKIILGMFVVVAGLACFVLHGGLLSDDSALRRSLASSDSESPLFNPMKPRVNFSPIFATDFGETKDCNGKSYAELKSAYQRDGGVTFKSCSLGGDVLDGAEKFTKNIEGEISSRRAQDAYKAEGSVMLVAIDPDIMEFLSYLHDRKAFPFQTLNFPVGTQQTTHSDVVHFDTLPTRGLMTAAWTAFEDIHPDSGPLRWYPGSHKLGVWDFDELGIRGRFRDRVDLANKDSLKVYDFYILELQATIDRLKLPSRMALLKRGESFLWAANLLHGGSAVNDKTLSRLSQVTHYWLEGAEKYWTPRLSYPSADKYRIRCSQPTCHSSLHTDCAAVGLAWFKKGTVMSFARPKHHTNCVEFMMEDT
ncbi:hypothetical protein B484DRAFT_459918 [Ochromonadaceae sp. CCMP2298]|nr:hypothetical protein B484DRAFT_459918 [Ochromonadaceae sp. CCMP2298]|eukprot:CAMPEP_0173226456 /NCGR_PEP_ID=MMETSP1142-20121109/5445_1 /TAXON_ID=483371 /ORGANISM="non described non described, Strain CCMP2298" /LENGTH=365 /DNA_ID=CAMNT_0014154917 /DNA_START=209 /DNA_END=1306 /DNA_ORIENTATION=+